MLTQKNENEKELLALRDELQREQNKTVFEGTCSTCSVIFIVV